MALVDLDGLEAALGYQLRPAEEGIANSVISQVTSGVEAYTGLSFVHVVDDVITTQADSHGIVELHKGPIDLVSSVKNLQGQELLDRIDPFLTNTVQWDGSREVYGLGAFQTVVLTYTHGLAAAPQDLRDVAVSMAARQVINPAGIRQETVGGISVTYASVFGQAGSIAPSNWEQVILDRYRGAVSSLRI